MASRAHSWSRMPSACATVEGTRASEAARATLTSPPRRDVTLMRSSSPRSVRCPRSRRSPRASRRSCADSAPPGRPAPAPRCRDRPGRARSSPGRDGFVRGLRYVDLTAVRPARYGVDDDGGVRQHGDGPRGALLVAEAGGEGALRGVRAGHEVGAVGEVLVLEPGGEGGHRADVGLGEEDADGGDVALGGVGVGGAQKPLTPDRGEDVTQQRVKGVRTPAVRRHGDPGPGPVGPAGTGPLPLHGGRKQLIDRHAVPQLPAVTKALTALSAPSSP